MLIVSVKASTSYALELTSLNNLIFFISEIVKHPICETNLPYVYLTNHLMFNEILALSENSADRKNTGKNKYVFYLKLSCWVICLKYTSVVKLQFIPFKWSVFLFICHSVVHWYISLQYDRVEFMIIWCIHVDYNLLFYMYLLVYTTKTLNVITINCMKWCIIRQ